jgi:hypothetical protein
MYVVSSGFFFCRPSPRVLLAPAVIITTPPCKEIITGYRLLTPSSQGVCKYRAALAMQPEQRRVGTGWLRLRGAEMQLPVELARHIVRHCALAVDC